MEPKASKRVVLWIVPILLIGALFLYFRPASNQSQYIELAQNYTVPNSTISFSESLSTYCSDEDWKFFETNRGQKVVEFSGSCDLEGSQLLNIQFLIDDDNEVKVGAMLIEHQQIEEEEKPNLFAQLAKHDS